MDLLKRWETLSKKYNFTKESFSKYFDHTLLKPEATRDKVLNLIEEAKRWNFASICVNPAWVRLAAENLKGTDIGVCTVVGFPLGATSTYAKISEAVKAVSDGATEIDMVLNIGWVKEGNYEAVIDEISAIKEAIGDRVLKVIIECALLTDEEKKLATDAVRAGGADFVKTSTGFGPGGATVHDVKLLREVAGESLKVKAAGGIRNLSTALDMIEAGADRIGASASARIMEELESLLRGER